ncbi:MAG: ATP-binding protein, partial [Pseudomonadota bacterium]
RETVLDHLLPVFEVAALNTDLTTQVHRLEVPSLTLSEKGAGLDPDAPRAFHLEPPDANERAGLWQATLGLKAPEEARALAEDFVLDADEIEAIARRTPQGPERAAAARAEAVRALRPAADPLVSVLDPKAGWPDLILPERTVGALRAITAQARHRHQVYAEWGFSGPTGRGRGLTALFSGPSGTGKTLAAEVIAHELGLGLLRVDLSQVVDKYVGETEKHLDRVFTLADRSGAVLLFDEAEALFRQRGDDDAGARHFVSMTVSYLLQRLESCRGTCLLTTNMRSAVDDAFLRRLRFVVPFAFPALAERQRLWAAAFPPEAPQSGLDHARLAALPVAGGTICTIALNAAFLAAEDSGEIGMTHVIAALELDNAKLDQPIDLGPLRRRRAI